MKRRSTDTGRRAGIVRRTEPGGPSGPHRGHPTGERSGGVRRIPTEGRRRFDGVSIEQLWGRVEALTTQTQEHRDTLDELPALLAKIEAGLALLGDYQGNRPIDPGVPWTRCGLPVEVRDPDRHGGVDLDAPADRIETCQGTERTDDGMVCLSCGGSHGAPHV